MEDQSKTLAVSVRAKEFVSYHCSCCGHCCRHIENCVMVESLDAYRMAKHLRNQHCDISSTDDVLLRYCEPMPLTDEGYPIYVLKTVGADATCIFLRENQCSIYVLLLQFQEIQFPHGNGGCRLLLSDHRFSPSLFPYSQ